MLVSYSFLRKQHSMEEIMSETIPDSIDLYFALSASPNSDHEWQ